MQKREESFEESKLYIENRNLKMKNGKLEKRIGEIETKLREEEERGKVFREEETRKKEKLKRACQER